MKIIELRVNHIEKPFGFKFHKEINFSYKVVDVSGTKQTAARLEISLDEKFNDVIFDSGKDCSIKSNQIKYSLNTKPRTRYFWRVTVWTDADEKVTSDVAWFETGKMNEEWRCEFITVDSEKEFNPVIKKSFLSWKEIDKARLYISGLGLYEAYINGVKVGHEYLTPGNNDYDTWIQYQTYDITDSIAQGDNEISVILGDGWYKGNFGFNGGMQNIYGDGFALIAEINITYKDGSEEVIGTDNSWKCYESNIIESGIYRGEVLDLTFNSNEEYNTKKIDLDKSLLMERMSLPVKVKETIKPRAIIKTKSGETVIDMGQNMAGWMKFKNTLPKGRKIILQHGEILQDGCFYRENLRLAKAEFIFISDGEEKWIRPHFTYFGFRYVKVTGWDDLNIEDFIGEVVYSDMDTIGDIKTNNEKVNRLYLNALWGQKGNFVDIPTDCPQRDERMGWTGDAQVFSRTAALNMDVYAFFRKYTFDIANEQKKVNGAVPMTIPNIPNPTMPKDNVTSSGWGDAATIIPWNMYLFYGDKGILEQQFDSMKCWVDYITESNGGKLLWTTRFHFGDWLALDGENPKAPNGGTDPYFVASAYYYYSANIVSKAAGVLGKKELEEQYRVLADNIKREFQNEYISVNGRLTIDKQTAYVLTLYMDLCREEHKERVAHDLAVRLKKDNNHIKTGFIGTPYICKVLSDYGYNDLAYTLLLNEEFPSWLYEVDLGATTIWERWNSVLPDGRMNPMGMNSLNHYAYGAVAEWMYGYMAGIRVDENNPGFKTAVIAPKPDWRMKQVCGRVNTISGEYKSTWSILPDGKLKFIIDIPFNGEAEVILPDADVNDFEGREISQKGSDVTFRLKSGHFEFEYMPTKEYVKHFDEYTTLSTLLEIVPTKKILSEVIPQIINMKPYKLPSFLGKNLSEIKEDTDLNISEESFNEAVKRLKSL